MKINAIKIDINTTNGEFGSFYEFKSGLNIIRGNNSTGKSTLFQSIIYALGLEELLRGKNADTMQSVLKDSVEDNDKKLHKVLQSSISLEIENSKGKAISIIRHVKNSAKDPKLIEVCETRMLTKHEKGYIMSKYIHDSGGANNEEFGFHYYLAKFLNWNLPEVVNTKGTTTQLYIQQLAPAFIIEQKLGWSDFLATIPYYGIKQAQSRVIEFLLKMDIFENIKKKQESKIRENSLKEEWKTYYIQMQDIARDCRYELQGMTEKPEIIDETKIQLIKKTETSSIDIYCELEQLNKELANWHLIHTNPIGDNVEIYEKQIEILRTQLKTNSIKFNLLSEEITIFEQQLCSYKNQLKDIERDLYKNKGALKVQNLGAKIGSSIANCTCPTCNQKIKNSLLPNEVKEIPMHLEDNIDYLNSQKKMIEAFIEGQEKELNKKKDAYNNLNSIISQMRSDIRNLEKELVKDPRLLSEFEISQKLELQKRIGFYKKKVEDFENLRTKICYDFMKEYATFLSKEKYDEKDILSHNDKDKIKFLGSKFIQNLKEFNYSSKPTDTIKISDDTYFPITDGYNIRFDSSASDFIRCIWAYTIALLETSNEQNGNHPNILMLDEPKQQDAAMEDFKYLIKKLSELKETQTLIFASFENNDNSFTTATNNIDFNLIKIGNKLIIPIEN